MPSSEELISSLYRHDLGSPYNLFLSSLEDDTDVLGVDELGREDTEELEEAVGYVEEIIEELDGSDDLQQISGQAGILSGYKGRFPGKVGEHMDKIAELSGFVHLYTSRLEDPGCANVGDLLEPLEEEGAMVEYNETRDLPVQGDTGLCLVANTIALNWKQHGRESEESGLWAEVEELPGSYSIGIWDDGPGLDEDMDPERIFERGVGSNTGKGLYLAQSLTEFFGGSLKYSEEYASREDGFGLEWEVLKPGQYSTSESS